VRAIARIDSCACRFANAVVCNSNGCIGLDQSGLIADLEEMRYA
jgi:hypothetical protein